MTIRTRLNPVATVADAVSKVERAKKTTFYDDFTTKADGALTAGTVSDSGHTYTVLGQIPWAISGGRLTHTQTNPVIAQSSYLGVNLGIESGDKVGYIWADYEVPSGADPQESIVLIATATDFCADPAYEFANAAAHCSFTDTAVRLDNLHADHPGLTTTTIGRGLYTALTPGTYRVEIAIDGDRAYMTSPDGMHWRTEISANTDAYGGPWATLQLYNQGTGTMKALKILRWGAELQTRSSRGPATPKHQVARVATRPPRLLGAMQTSGSGAATALTSSTSAKLYGLTIAMPQSKHVLIEGLTWFDEQVPATKTLQQLLLGVYVDGNSSYGKLTCVRSGYTAANAMQTYAVTVSGSAGTWTFTLGGTTSSAIAYNASAATAQAAIEAMSNVGAGNVVVTKSGTTFTLVFGSGTAGLPALSDLNVSVAGTGGATAAVTATYTNGVLIPWALELTTTHLSAFTVGDQRDFQVKAQANASNLYTFIDSGDASGGTSTIRRSTLKIFELP